MCGGADRRRALARRRTSAPGRCCAPAGRATCCSPHDDAALRLPGGARPLPVLPRPRLGAGAVGRAADPGRRRVLLPQLRARPGRSRSTRARPGRPSPSCRSAPGTSSSRPTRRSPRCGPTSRRCWSARRTTSRSRLPGADRRLLRAGRAAAARCGAASTAGRTAPRALDAFFADVAAQPPAPAGGRVMTELAFAVARRRARAVRRRAAPAVPAAGRARPAAQRCTRSRCAARCGSSRSAGRYDDAEQDGPGRPVRRPRSGGASTLKPFLWTHAVAMVPGFTGSTEVDLPVACTYDFEVGGDEVPARAARRRGAAACCCSAARCSPAATPASRVEQVPWDLRGALPAAGRRLARR